MILFFCSCTDNQSYLDDIKWDFYKKNIENSFNDQTKMVPFYRSEISIEEIENSKGRCFYGKFIFKEYSSTTDKNISSGIPVVHTICYSNDLESITGYYSGDSFYVDTIDLKREKDEDEKLKSIIKQNDVVDILRSM